MLIGTFVGLSQIHQINLANFRPLVSGRLPNYSYNYRRIF